MALLPGAAMFELIAVANSALLDSSQKRKAAALTSVSIQAPLQLTSAHNSQPVMCSVDPAAGTFELKTTKMGQKHSVLHTSGIYTDTSTTALTIQSVLLNSMLKRLLRQWTTQLPPLASVMGSIRAMDSHIVGYMTHPAILDANLHLTAAAAPSADGKIRVPASLAVLTVSDYNSTGLFTPSAQPTIGRPDGTAVCSIKLMNPAQQIAVDLCDLLIKEMPPRNSTLPETVAVSAAEALRTADGLMYETHWQAFATPAALPTRDGADSTFSTQSSRVTSELGEGRKIADVPSLTSNRHLRINMLPRQSKVSTASRQQCGSIIHSIQRSMEVLRHALRASKTGSNLELITAGSTPATQSMGSAVRLTNAAVSGAATAAIIRVAANEYTSTTFCGLDVAATHSGTHAYSFQVDFPAL